MLDAADRRRPRSGCATASSSTTARRAPAGVRRIDGARIELTIHEGRNRQVKRMLEAVGHRVRRLHRSRYANLTVEGLEPGEWRELRRDEAHALVHLAQRRR